jgi:hypothetical protein
LNYNIEFGKSTLDASAYVEYLKAHQRDHSLPTNRIESIDLGAGAGYIPYSTALPFTYAPSVVGASRIDAGLFSILVH